MPCSSGVEVRHPPVGQYEDEEDTAGAVKPKQTAKEQKITSALKILCIFLISLLLP